MVSFTGMNVITMTVSAIGSSTLQIFEKVGKFFLFCVLFIRQFSLKQIFWKNLFREIMTLGYYSIPIIGLTGMFTGAVLALQLYSGFASFGAEETVPLVVMLSIVKELSPVLCGLMFVSRCGSSITAQIGGMKINNQIDSLVTLSINPFRFIAIPKLIAAMIVLPLLTFLADIIGIIGGYLVGTKVLHFSSFRYLTITADSIVFNDVYYGLVKAFYFAIAVIVISCYHGFNAKDGAVGLGRATTNSVVFSSIAILSLNYILTFILF